jgi:hypothetical protein
VAKIVITYEYEPNMEHYPAGTETAAEAMKIDVEQVQNGSVYWDEFLEGGSGKITVEVVE